MRRWFVVIWLLAGFAGQGYVWSARPRLPVAIERPLAGPDVTGGILAPWWITTAD